MPHLRELIFEDLKGWDNIKSKKKHTTGHEGLKRKDI
jgi:hypothetical protein